VVRYHAFAAEHLNAPPAGTTDDLMVQKVLVKLRGGARQRQLLSGLQKTLGGLHGHKLLSPGCLPIWMNSDHSRRAGKVPPCRRRS